MSPGSIASFPAHFELVRLCQPFGSSPDFTLFVFHATMNASMRSPVKASNRYAFGIAVAYGEPRYGTRMSAWCCMKNSSVPFVSTTSAPEVPADDSWYIRAVTSSDDARYMSTLTPGYFASNAFTTPGPIVRLSVVYHLTVPSFFAAA